MESRLKWRSTKVVQDHAKGVKPTEYTPAMTSYYNYLKSGKAENKTVEYALVISNDSVSKEIIEALLLAKADSNDVTECFGITKEVLELYKELFFDVTEFRSRLDEISYLENYQNKVGKDLKIRAWTLGPAFIYFTYGNTMPQTTEQKSLLKRLFMVSTYRAMEAQFNTINSQVSKQSMEWAKMMMKAYEVIDKLMRDDQDNSKELIDIIVEKGLFTGSVINHNSDEDTEFV